MESSRKRKLAPEFNRSDLEREMRRQKLKILEDHADFGFLVGAEKGSAVLMHCFKSDLLAAGGYFGGLLRSPCAGNPPVHMKHHHPHIFKMILKFISLQTVDEDLSLEDIVALALAADEFLLLPLKRFCVSEIKRLLTVDNVWNTLNLMVQIPDLADVCAEVLSLETKKCLEHESFLVASEESLIFLLKMETLAIDSELDLIEAVIKMAKTKPEKEEVEMMNAVIPHLRLLTLSMDKLDQLSEYLTDSQMSYLAKRLTFKAKHRAGKVPPSLNVLTSLRSRPKNQKFMVEFIAEDLIKTDWQIIGLNPRKRKTWNTLQLVAGQHLVVKGIEILTKANTSPKNESASNDDEDEESSGISSLEEKYKEDMIVVAWISFNSAKMKEVFYSDIHEEKEYNSWFSVDFGKKVFVPKGATCHVSVRSSNIYQLIPSTHIKDNIDKAVKYAEFSQIGFNLYERKNKGDTNYIEKSWNKEGDNVFNIKSLSVVPVDETCCLDDME